MVKDIVKEIKVETKNDFRGIQMKSFEAVGTTPSEWKPVEIKSIEESEGEVFIHFKFPVGYKEVSPIFLVHPESKKTLENIQQTAFGMGSSQELTPTYTDICRLCGHPIKYPFYIQNDKRKLIMQVGSTCVNIYGGARYTKKMIKVFKDNEIRKKFREWKDHAIEECNRHKVSERSIYIEYPFWKLREKIIKTDPEKTTSRKLKNLMEKGNRMFKGDLK